MRNLLLKFLVFVLLFSAGCVKAPAEKIKVVATTSLIEVIVKEVGGDRVDVVTIVPSGMCPGHFDVKPGDIAATSKAKLLLSHGWEGWMQKLLNSVENEELVTKVIDVKGNWMIPEVHIKAVQKITNVLCESDKENRRQYEENSREYIKDIRYAAARIKKFKDVKAIASNMQAPFVEWLGIEVVASYGRPEELTPSEIIKLINIAKKEKVGLVVDNMQSGPVAGKRIAEDIGAKHVTLTNFPHKGSYIDSLERNVNAIIQALK